MKDPAVLLYINDWLVSTADMDADCRGWFLNLLLHNYDKGSLPDDIEKLAVLCNVRFSEFNRFEQVFEQVLKHKFNKDLNGTLTNERTKSILRKREAFKEKRSTAGKMSYLMRFFAKKYPAEYRKTKVREFIRQKFDFTTVDLKNEQVLEQVFEHLFELYRNENENNIYSIDNSNNTSNNNIDNTNTREKKNNSKTFSTPTIEEVSAYCVERQNYVDPEKFHSHYTSVGWKVGKNPMKDWKAAVRTWEKNNNNKANQNGTEQQPQQERFAGRQSKQQVYDAIQRELANPYDPRFRE